MHFSIPDTAECQDKTGSAYTVFNIHINGVYHCSVRYSQFYSFHEQLKKEFGSSALPQFPPKKLLSLTPNQLEERRSGLERYIQIISQNPVISGSNTFNGFLLSAQQESQQEDPEDVTLDVYLLNGHKTTISITSTDQTDDVLETTASQIELSDDFVYYFGLYLVKKEEGKEHTIVRKLQEFESPFISLKAANASGSHRIVLRKSYWDPTVDDELMDDRIAMNLLFVQGVSDVERDWVIANKEQRKQLSALHQRGSKKEYLRFARTMKYYGYIHFKPCTTDYPRPDSRVFICAGNKELNLRVQVGDDVKEASFKVTRMRCWRITTTIPDINGDLGYDHHPQPSKLELAFEYLVARDTLKWISVTSEQAILMSMCLQSMVDELIMKKEGRRIKRPHDRNKSKTGEKSEVNLNTIGNNEEAQSNSSTSSSLNREPASVVKRLIAGPGTRGHTQMNNGSAMSENEAFEGIGDDDL